MTRRILLTALSWHLADVLPFSGPVEAIRHVKADHFAAVICLRLVTGLKLGFVASLNWLRRGKRDKAVENNGEHRKTRHFGCGSKVRLGEVSIEHVLENCRSGSWATVGAML